MQGIVNAGSPPGRRRASGARAPLGSPGLLAIGLVLVLSGLVGSSGTLATPTPAGSPHAGAASEPSIVLGPPLAVTVSATPSSFPLGFTTTLQASASGGTPPYAYAYASLPAGCGSLNAPWLNCTPTSTGAWTVVVTATDATSATAQGSVGVSVTTASSLTAQLTANPSWISLGQTTTLHTAAVGGKAPYTYAYSGLPTGCSPANADWLNCTPTTVGSWSPLVYVVDNSGTNASASSTAAITVEPPTLQAGATGSPLNGPAPLAVSFGGSASGGSPPYSWNWSFGDGSAPSLYPNPTHVYNRTGDFVANLTVRDAKDHLSQASVTISVTPTGGSGVVVSPSANPSSGPSPLNVTFDANPSGGTPPYTISWNFGDGAFGSGNVVLHAYVNPGHYNATVNATDSLGRSGVGTLAVYVAPSGCSGCPLKVVVGASPSTGPAPLAVSFWANATGGVGPYSTTWSFGDGGNGSGAVVQHTFGAPGNFTAVATVRDAQGHTSTGSFAIRVAAVPLLVGGGDTPRAGLAPLNVSFAADVTGGTLPYTLQWIFGDGTNGSGVPVGTTYHLYTAVGTYAPWLQVQDGSGRVQRIALPWVHVNASSTSSSPASSSSTPTAPLVWVGLGGGVAGALIGAALLLSGRRRSAALRLQGEEMVRAMRTDKEPVQALTEHDRPPPPPG